MPYSACRGGGYDDGIPVRPVSNINNTSYIPEKWPTYADILYVYATIR